MAPAPLVVVMGVCGSGKTTVGNLLAERIGAEFFEGDEAHPPGNVELMAAGVPLTDHDRRDWLLALAQRLAHAHSAGRALVVSCSALKRSYRDILRGASPDLVFVHLHAEQALLEARLAARVDHFMPASLLASQLQTLERLGDDEKAIVFDSALPAELIASQAVAWLTAMNKP